MAQIPHIKGRPHVGAHDLRELLPVLKVLPALTFPVHSAGELLDQLGQGTKHTIRGIAVDPARMIKYMPAYYFPLTSNENLIEKMAELVRNNRRQINPAEHRELLLKHLPKLHFPLKSSAELETALKNVPAFAYGDRKITPKEALGLLPAGFFPVEDEEDLVLKSSRFLASAPLIEAER